MQRNMSERGARLIRLRRTRKPFWPGSTDPASMQFDLARLLSNHSLFFIVHLL